MMSDTIIQLVSNGLLLVFGAGLAKYTVSNYQKSKDITMTRENLVKLYSKLYLAHIHLVGSWNNWIRIFGGHLGEKIDVKMEIDLLTKFSTAVAEAESILMILYGRLKSQLKLDETKTNFIEESTLYLSDFNFELAEAIDNTKDDFKQVNEALNEKSEKVNKYMTKILEIILKSKIDI